MFHSFLSLRHPEVNSRRWEN